MWWFRGAVGFLNFHSSIHNWRLLLDFCHAMSLGTEPSACGNHWSISNKAACPFSNMRSCRETSVPSATHYSCNCAKQVQGFSPHLPRPQLGAVKLQHCLQLCVPQGSAYRGFVHPLSVAAICLIPTECSVCSLHPVNVLHPAETQVHTVLQPTSTLQNETLLGTTLFIA